jgi:hypothetical protein
MQFYSHLSDDERDQISILRAAGHDGGHCPGARSSENHDLQGAAESGSAFGRNG